MMEHLMNELVVGLGLRPNFLRMSISLLVLHYFQDTG